MKMSTQQQTLLEGLTDVVGEDHVLQGDDVSRVLALCYATRQGVVTHGGLTGSNLLNRARIFDAC